MPVRIVQVVPNISRGDAVSNNCLAIEGILKEAGYDAEIRSLILPDNKDLKKLVRPLSGLRRLKDDDVMLYHMATALQTDLTRWGGRIIFQYHNITPPEFFQPYDHAVAEACRAGLSEMKSLRNTPEACWADSEFNKKDLTDAGYICPIHTVPILVPFEDYEQPADRQIIETCRDDHVNFLFVGRIVPNKAQEDVIRAFAWYQKNINGKCRLFLIGNTSLNVYRNRLQEYIELLDIRNVIMPGHIRFSEILAYYQAADVFLSMSRHEGFCVPLLEAMFFGIPIVARNTSAIPYTLGDAGLLLEDNNPAVAALAADRVLHDRKLKEEIIRRQDARLADFSHEKVKERILKELKDFE